MKRHESIKPLSRDHHLGLLCGWKLRQGIKNGAASSRMQSYITYFYTQHLKEHFREEEQILFVDKKDALVIQAVQEHREIEKLVTVIMSKADHSLFLLFADKLEAHIRFEERTLFPHLEKVLTSSELESVGKKIEKLHEAIAADDFEDNFWEK